MGQYNKAIITAAGESLIARAIVGEIQLNITKAKTSDHKYPDSTYFKDLTDMQGIKQVMTSPETKVLSGDLIQTRVLFSNEEIQATYYIQNIGLYAMDGAQEVLFCIVTATTPDEMPQYNGVASTSYIYNIQNAVQDAAELNIIVSPSGTATLQDVQERVGASGGDISETVIETLEHIDTKYPVPSAGESTKVFMGKVKKYIEDTKPLDADMFVYVSTTGSDTTGTGESTAPYKTITYALSKVPRDLGGYTATVNVADGTYNESVNITGYNGGYLYIKRNGAQELNNLCNIKSISVQYCSNVSVVGFNLTNTEGTSVFAKMCEFVNVVYCQSIVTTVSDEVSFNFDYVSVGRISGCRSLSHNMCLRSYQSNVFSQNWSDDSWGTYGIFTDGGGCVTKGNTFQPRGLVANEVTPGGSIAVSNYGAKIGTLPANIALYVATTGSDTAGDGSSAKPYKTIQNALETLPKDLGSRTVTVNVADGTYEEGVNVVGFISGRLIIQSKDHATVINTLCNVYRIQMINCLAGVTIQGLNLYAPSGAGIDIYDSRSVSVFRVSCTSINNVNAAIYVENSIAHINECILSNHAYGIVVGAGSRAVCSGNTGINNTTGVRSTFGGVAHLVGNNLLPLSQAFGGSTIYENGTQISPLITSGLSCTWGTISGGYIRHGNLTGQAMITIQLFILTSVAVTAYTAYYITGFPQVDATNVAVTFAPQNSVSNCYLDGTTICFIPNANIGSGAGFLLNATYKTIV